MHSAIIFIPEGFALYLSRSVACFVCSSWDRFSQCCSSSSIVAFPYACIIFSDFRSGSLSCLVFLKKRVVMNPIINCRKYDHFLLERINLALLDDPKVMLKRSAGYEYRKTLSLRTSHRPLQLVRCFMKQRRCTINVVSHLQLPLYEFRKGRLN